MSISNSVSNVSQAIYEGCKIVYTKAVHPLVHLVCKILFSDIPHYTGKIVRKVTRLMTGTQPTIVRIEEAASSIFPLKAKLANNPTDLNFVVPEPFQVNREEINEEREGEQRGLWHQSIHVEQQAVDVINQKVEKRIEGESREVLQQFIQAEQQVVDVINQQIEEERDEQREEIDETVNQQVEERRGGGPREILQQFIQAEQQVVDVINQQIEEKRDEQREEIDETVNQQVEERREGELREVLPQPIQVETKETVPQLSLGVKLTKNYALHSTIPFYTARVGFPNPSYRNCSFNSLSVICAHIGCQIPAIHPDNIDFYTELALADAEEFKQVLGQKIAECEKRMVLKERELQTLREQEQIELEIIESAIEPAKTEFDEANASVFQFNPKEWEVKEDAELPSLRVKLSELKEKRKTDESESLSKEIYKLAIAINNQELRLLRHSHAISQAQKELGEALEKKKGALERKNQALKDKKMHWELKIGTIKQEINSIRYEQQKCEMALANQERLNRGAVVLAILRGESQGVLTMEDAQLLSGILVDEVQPRILYNGPKDARADIGQAALKEALYRSDWRALRVGGYGHWWVYVRNADGLTVDEINDANIYRKRMTIDQLFMTYSNPDEWSNTQITFYDGISA